MKGRKVYVVGVGMTKFEKPGRRENFDYPVLDLSFKTFHSSIYGVSHFLSLLLLSSFLFHLLSSFFFLLSSFYFLLSFFFFFLFFLLFLPLPGHGP